MNKNQYLIIFSLSILLAGCAGVSGSSNQTPADLEQSYTNILSFDYNNSKCDVYIKNVNELYYSYVYGENLTPKWTFSYEYHPKAYIDKEINDDLMYKLYEEAQSNISIINNFLKEDVNIYPHTNIFFFEHSVENEKSENLGIALIEQYISFTINYDREYYHISIPVKLNFLKQYNDQIQNFDNNNYLSISDFIQTYNITVKGE